MRYPAAADTRLKRPSISEAGRRVVPTGSTTLYQAAQQTADDRAADECVSPQIGLSDDEREFGDEIGELDADDGADQAADVDMDRQFAGGAQPAKQDG